MMGRCVVRVQRNRLAKFPIRFCELELVGEEGLGQRGMRFAQATIQLEGFLRGCFSFGQTVFRGSSAES